MLHIQNFWIDEKESNKDTVADCCGCSACASKCPVGAISMKYDDEGFLYPRVDSHVCVMCSACLNVCPINKSEGINNVYRETYAGYSLDKKIIYNSTSGGFITALSLKIIEQGGIIAGVRYNTDYVKSEYYLAKTKEEVFAFASSKYVQSEKKDIYKKIEYELKQGKSVLFVGCPCDVYAVQRYIGKEYDTFLSCEVVCMGVSSYKIASEYKAYAEKKNKSQLIRINARSKRKGWFVPHLEEEYENGTIKCNTLYGTFLGYGMQVYNRPSCFRCKFRGTNGVGDIRVGDFWGIKKTDSYWNPDGVSCIFVRTEHGEKAIHILNESEFFLFKTEYKTAISGNMSSYSNKSDKYVRLRIKFADIFKKRGLIAACIATGTISFWTKHIVPDRFHVVIKRVYHFFRNER